MDRTLLNRGYCLEMDGQLGPALADYADACERGHDMACENQALLQGQGIKAERLADQPPPKLRRREVTAGGTVVGSASAGGSASGTAGGATVSHSARGTVTSGGAAVGKEDL